METIYILRSQNYNHHATKVVVPGPLTDTGYEFKMYQVNDAVIRFQIRKSYEESGMEGLFKMLRIFSGSKPILIKKVTRYLHERSYLSKNGVRYRVIATIQVD